MTCGAACNRGDDDDGTLEDDDTDDDTSPNDATAADGFCNVTDPCRNSTCWNEPCDGCSFGGGPTAGCYRPEQLQSECTWYWSSSAVVEEPDKIWIASFTVASIHNDFLDGDSPAVLWVREAACGQVRSAGILLKC